MRRILLFFSFCLALQAHGQNNVTVLPVPAIGFAPETDWYFGAVSLFTIDLYRDSITRTSNAKIEFNYTLRNQIILETGWNYFFREDAWFTRGTLRYSKYPDLYYGLGAETPDSAELRYQSFRSTIDFDVLKKVKNSLFAGLGIRYLDYSGIRGFDKEIPFSELESQSNYGIRLVTLIDSRNNILTPISGSFLELSSSLNRGKETYLRLIADARTYWKYANDDYSLLAFRFFQSSVFGTPNFYDYSLIGGDRFVRGYFYGRFRDKHLTSMQTELRQRIYKALAFAVFGGVSGVYSDLKAFDSENIKANLGFGLRYRVDKKENTHLRLDYAIGSGSQDGFYISFGEAF